MRGLLTPVDHVAADTVATVDHAAADLLTILSTHPMVSGGCCGPLRSGATVQAAPRPHPSCCQRGDPGLAGCRRLASSLRTCWCAAHCLLHKRTNAPAWRLPITRMVFAIINGSYCTDSHDCVDDGCPTTTAPFVYVTNGQAGALHVFSALPRDLERSVEEWRGWGGLMDAERHPMPGAPAMIHE